MNRTASFPLREKHTARPHGVGNALKRLAHYSNCAVFAAAAFAISAGSAHGQFVFQPLPQAESTDNHALSTR